MRNSAAPSVDPLAAPPERYRLLAPLRRYLVSVVVLALLPLAALLAWQIVRTAGDEQAQIEGDLARSAAAFAAAVDSEILASLDALTALSHAEALRRDLPAAFERLLRTRPPTRRDWQGVFLVDPRGRLLLDSGANRAPIADALPALRQRVLETSQPAVSSVLEGPGRELVLLAVPVALDDQTGVLGARLPAATWQRLAGAAGRPEGGYAVLHDARQRVIATSLPGPLKPGAQLPPGPVAASRGRPFGVERTAGLDGSEVYAAWQVVRSAPGWGVQIMVPAAPIVAARQRTVATALAAGAGSLLLGALLASLAARRVTRPLRTLAAEGHAGLPGPIEVQEIAMLRDALQAASLSDARSRRALEEDIAKRRRIEDELLEAHQVLQEQQRLIELTQEAGRVGFCQYRFDTGELFWTQGHCKLFGLDGLDGDGLAAWLDRIGPEDRERVRGLLDTACAERHDALTVEYAVPQPDDTARWLSSRLQFEYDDAGAPLQFAGVSVDMTDQREAELQREELTRREVTARRDAEAASRAKDELLAMLGHELRNPLGAISAAADVLEAAPPASNSAGEARAIIGRQARNLAHMVHELLDVGRAITGQLTLARRPVNLASVLDRLRGTLQVTGESGAHELHLDAQDVWVHGDAVRLEQVLSNLLGNALKYTPAGRRIDVTIRAEGATAVIEVRDTGSGIAPALLPRVFDLFVQGERPLDRRAGGLGIGLTLVRRVVELHGGTVAATSSPEGTCFTLRLPAIDPPLQPEGDTLPPGRRRRVLVIDDNADVLAALRSKLELDGHSVSTAADGIDGLNRLLRQQPEVSIVDIGLPGLTGYELARHARAAGYAGRMIALSGYGQERDIHDALVAGFDAYLVKPVERGELRASLRAA
ncbi:ATP-binding protein [Ramlibacter pinisoli]|uniref:histidine kinase n=1 Tax=Ramlibacter pinisoli TaxID=2682844 RepID=A0A6N8J1L4_9BURK|nr:ATP-binding protein [Ramlibacter pinisoli]MVQ32183.1 response regulator [Ramlibacter pinisoli]